jgi:hypothetical protein
MRLFTAYAGGLLASDSSPEPVSYASALTDPPVTDQGEEVAFAAGVLDSLWSMAGRAPVWELLRTAISRTGYEATLALSDRESGGMGRQRNNVLKLLEFAREWGGSSLSEFLRRVQALKGARSARGRGFGKHAGKRSSAVDVDPRCKRVGVPGGGNRRSGQKKNSTDVRFPHPA